MLLATLSRILALASSIGLSHAMNFSPRSELGSGRLLSNFSIVLRRDSAYSRQFVVYSVEVLCFGFGHARVHSGHLVVI
jgi:hypothetical protein